jgi:glycosyltransferase involved in cell wall biosynthesis
VKFYGAYDPSERESFLRKFFTHIDYLLVPSQDDWETLSMAALEALQHGVPTVVCRTGGLKSFAHQQLGPAPTEVVRLIAPKLLTQTLNELALQPRRSQAVGECRDYFEKYFSDKVVSLRWLEILKKYS